MNLVHVSTFPPEPCGLAEYAWQLFEALSDIPTPPSQMLVRVLREATTPARNGDIWLKCDDAGSYVQLAEYVNNLPDAVVIVQHEYKIFGGKQGDYINHFLSKVSCPVITTLHSVSSSLPEERRQVLNEIVKFSSKLLVFSNQAKNILLSSHDLKPDDVIIIRHGVPDVEFKYPDHPNSSQPDGIRFASLGLIRPSKGLENAIRAFASVRNQLPAVQYTIYGIDHPRNNSAGEYRMRLTHLIRCLDLSDTVHLVNKFLTRSEMVACIQANDVGVLPYSTSEQSSSGVLPLFLAAGRPLVTTAFQYAAATMTCDNGIVVNDSEPSLLRDAIINIGSNAGRRKSMMLASYMQMRPALWRNVALAHIELANGLVGQRLV